jgi:hypothetical protein
MESNDVKTCNRCKKTKNIIDFTKGNNILKRCLRCRDMGKKSREKNKCEHNRRKNDCKDCGGSSICEHNRQKHYCKYCGGSSICEHNRRKSCCKLCGGSQICSHNRRKNECKDCGGSQICHHNRRKYICKDCGGSSICEHNKFKQHCKLCGGSSICEHNRQKHQCKICGDEMKLTINYMVHNSKIADKRSNRYDQTNFIDKCFVKNLIEDCEDKCYYCKCELQYINFTSNLATIERIDNKLGHIKGNCVIACKTCNVSKVGNKL